MSLSTAVADALAQRPHEQSSRQVSARIAAGHGNLLLQGGVLLFFFGLINGFFLHGMAAPRVGLAAHLIALMGGTFLLAIGLMWPQLRLSPHSSLVGLVVALFSFFGGWLIYLLAGIWGAGGLFPLNAGQMRSTAFQERLVSVGFTLVAAAMIGLCLLLLWGLRFGRQKDAS